MWKICLKVKFLIVLKFSLKKIHQKMCKILVFKSNIPSLLLYSNISLYYLLSMKITFRWSTANRWGISCPLFNSYYKKSFVPAEMQYVSDSLIFIFHVVLVFIRIEFKWIKQNFNPKILRNAFRAFNEDFIKEKIALLILTLN